MFLRHSVASSSRRAFFAVFIVALICSVSACKTKTKNDDNQDLSNHAQESDQNIESSANPNGDAPDPNSAENAQIPSDAANLGGAANPSDAANLGDAANPGDRDLADKAIGEGASPEAIGASAAEIALEAPLLSDEEAKQLDENLRSLKDPNAKSADFDAYMATITQTKPNPEAALRFIYAYESRFGASERTTDLYQKAIARHPVLNAKPRYIKPGNEISGMKRLGGGSTLVYKFYKDGKTVAAFKPLQSRYQSNYRSEIAAYRLCPVMKCGFDVPKNFHVYFDFKEFSGLYARNKANVPSEFKEIIPTKLPDNAYRVDGTYKEWVPDYADYPIEMTSIWQPWLNPGTTRESLDVPLDDVLSEIAKKHPSRQVYAQKLEKHFAGVTQYDLARQISNLFVFDFLINNWDRFSGLKSLYGVNCQFAHGRFMSIDNGASFSQTPNPKPEKNLHKIQRFSKLTYDAIAAFDRDQLLDYLFQEPTTYEKQKFETFWNQRQAYLDYVESCIEKNGESETFFFE